jgi:hypothetical protein
MKIIVLSAGHSSIVRGAAGPEPWGDLDEVNEARVMEQKCGLQLVAAMACT